VDDIAKFDRKLATEKEEIALAGALAGLRKQVSKEFSSGNYDKGLKALAGLRSPVDAFFDRVMVMDENPAVRSNRLALLSEIRRLFLRVGDISRVRVES